MIEQGKLLEYMEEIKAIAVSQQGRMAREEIDKYLSDMELDGGQMDAVYRYLCASGVTVEGYEYVPEQPEPKRSAADGPAKAGKAAQGGRAVRKPAAKAQRNLQIYQREVSALDGLAPEEEREMMRRFLSGESGLRNEILQGHLQRVILLAKKYRKRSVPEDEVIAEGNIGLMNAMSMLEQNGDSFLEEDGWPDMDKIHSVIEMEIRHAMEAMIDEMTEKKDWEDTIVAKTNLLHEAVKYLAEEMGRTATQEELSEYTRMPIEEIRSIMGIAYHGE